MAEKLWIGLAPALLLLFALILILAGRAIRGKLGLGNGGSVSVDRITLTSARYGLTGRPDRLIRAGRTMVPEEWKSSRKVWPSHEAQLGVYFILIEDHFRVRPPHGFIVLGDGSRHLVKNTPELRAFVLEKAAGIREARQQLAEPIRVQPRPGQCRACGMRPYCGQAIG